MTDVSLAEVVAIVEARYDPSWARSWDAVGLVCGDPDQPVRRIHVAVDPVAEVVDEALSLGADLLLSHHPLYLGGTTSVAATRAKGRVVHRLITGGCGLLVAHTNADVADPGVSDALADTLGLTDVVVLHPDASDPTASAGRRGLGRIGRLASTMTAADLVRHVARSLPATAWGVRAAGIADREVRTVAVCGGSGGDLVERAASMGADALVTADLKHHSTSEATADHGLVLVDAGHWATEWPWTRAAARLLAADLAAAGTTVNVTVSALVTDPWTLHATALDGGPDPVSEVL